jgi:ABC-2 type transport system permease protein
VTVNTTVTEGIPYEASLTAFARQSALEAGRLLRRWRRDPIVAVQALLFPTFLLVIYKLLIGKAVLAVTGSDSLYGLVPMCAVVGAVFGTLGAGLALPAERDSGLLSRLWVLPIHRASALTGRLLAEAIRTAASAVVLTVFGVALGLRFAGGWAAAVMFVLVPVMISVGVATAVIAIAVRADGRAMVTWLGAGCVVLLFFNTGVAPVELFPSWLQEAVRLQPMSPTIEAMRGLAEGGPVLWPLLQAGVWAVGLVAAGAARPGGVSAVAGDRSGQRVSVLVGVRPRRGHRRIARLQWKSRCGASWAPDRALAVVVRASSLGSRRTVTRHRPHGCVPPARRHRRLDRAAGAGQGRP